MFAKIFSTGTLALLAIVFTAHHGGPAHAEMSEIEREIAIQRACQAAIWGMPAVGIYGIELGSSRDLGAKVNNVIYFSKPMASRHGFLTPNNVTPYTIASLSTAEGPLVVEVPPAGEKVSYFGTFVDAWDRPIEDVGPPGADKGKGGKYLFLPPGYEGEVPEDGYLVYRPATFSVNFAFRPVAKNGGTYADQAAYSKTLKVYLLAEADNPSPTTFHDAYPKKWNTLPVYDHSFLTDLNTVIQREPSQPRDKAMMGMLAGIGIVKGEPFEPDAEMKAALTEGVRCAFDWMQHGFTTPGIALKPYFEGSQWLGLNIAPEQRETGFPFEEEDRVLIDERGGGLYFWATYVPKVLGRGSFYLMGLRDTDGDLLNGKDTYRLNVPKDTPAKDFWSAIVYSMTSKGFVEDVERVGLDSTQIDNLKVNDDGSVDLYFAPEAPEGQESNWIPTGEDFFLIFRLYGPDEPLFAKTWTLADVEKVN